MTAARATAADLGARLFGLGAIALGVTGLVWRGFATPWQPVSPGLPGYALLACAAALVSIGGGAALQVRRAARLGGLLLAALFGIFAVLWAIRVVRAPTVTAMWSGCAADVVLVTGALLAAGVTARDPWRLVVVRTVVGVCLLAFAAAHFVYSRETAGMVPPWMPPDAMTWAYATGVAHAVAGVALLTDILAAPAAWALTAMFAGFEALVWLPKLLSASADPMTWRGSAINLCLTAAALLLAAAIGRHRNQEKRR